MRGLVERFYQHMDTDPAVASIRAMHPASLEPSIQKLYEFLSGWLGGPPLYIEKRGHPRLRRRHLPFAIDRSAAAQWMMCMERALAEVELDQHSKRLLLTRFSEVADFMRNRSELV